MFLTTNDLWLRDVLSWLCSCITAAGSFGVSSTFFRALTTVVDVVRPWVEGALNNVTLAANSAVVVARAAPLTRSTTQEVKVIHTSLNKEGTQSFQVTEPQKILSSLTSTHVKTFNRLLRCSFTQYCTWLAWIVLVCIAHSPTCNGAVHFHFANNVTRLIMNLRLMAVQVLASELFAI